MAVDRTVLSEIEKYNQILTRWDYGTVIDGKRLVEGEDERIDWDKYRTLNPDMVEKYKIGTCWDLTTYEAQRIFNRPGFPKFKTLYVEADDYHGIYPTHTWLVFYLPGNSYEKSWFIFEASWKSHAGIKGFLTFKDSLHYMVDNLWIPDTIKTHGKIKTVYVREYISPKKYGQDPMQFMTYCRQFPVIYKVLPR